MVDAIHRKTIGDRIHAGLVKRYEQETGRWNQVLNRLVNVLKLKCDRDLSIRGKTKRNKIIIFGLLGE